MQTGVKSFGCENRTAQESPIQSWKLIGPSVVSASKSGAVSPSCNVILVLLVSNLEQGTRAALSTWSQASTPARPPTVHGHYFKE